MDVILALILKCRQDRDVASIHDYLGTQNRRQTISSAPLNQVLTTQQQPMGGDGGSSRRMCYRNYLGVPCKFGSQCKHIHAEPNSAARREFEQNPTEMERYGAWLEAFQEARKEGKPPTGSPNLRQHRRRPPMQQLPSRQRRRSRRRRDLVQQSIRPPRRLKSLLRSLLARPAAFRLQRQRPT